MTDNTAPESLKIFDVRRLELQPGDMPFLCTTHPISEKDAADLRRYWNEQFPRNTLLIIDNGATLSVVSSRKEDSQNDVLIWHPVGHSVPPTDEDVLVAISVEAMDSAGGPYAPVSVASWDGECWVDYDHGDITDAVTHWSEMPSGPHLRKE